MSHHEHDPELIECRECGCEFDLARQHYYDDICPSCLKEEEPERTWPGCFRCGDKYEPGTGHTVRVPPRGPGQSTEFLTVCSKECAQKLNPRYDP